MSFVGLALRERKIKKIFGKNFNEVAQTKTGGKIARHFSTYPSSKQILSVYLWMTA